MSYSKIYAIIVLILVSIVAITFGIGYYIDKSQEEQYAQFRSLEMKSLSSTEDETKKLALIARLKQNIAKLGEMATKDPSKIAIIETQKAELRLHIKSMENTRW